RAAPTRPTSRSWTRASDRQSAYSRRRHMIPLPQRPTCSGSAEATFSERTNWPRRAPGSVGWSHLGVVIVVAAAATTLESDFSRGLGLLASPPYQDGIGYVIMAKSFFYRLGHEPLHVLAEMAGGRAPLWEALLVFTFAVLGEGEWQAYAVRFWPTF